MWDRKVVRRCMLSLRVVQEGEGAVVKRLGPATRTASREGVTYKPPTAKIPIRADFCRFPSCRRRITGIGRRIMAKSVVMLIAAFVNHIANWLMHRAGSLVQKARTGTQAKILLKTVQIV
jgi:hypothetical protein